jgi:hypothetical protein
MLEPCQASPILPQTSPTSVRSRANRGLAGNGQLRGPEPVMIFNVDQKSGSSCRMHKTHRKESPLAAY